MKTVLDKLGSSGALVAAAACPVCFPKLALIGALFGLGAFGAYEAQLIVAAQILVGVALAGHVLAYRRRRSKWRLALAAAGAAAFFAGLYALEWIAYAGLAALIAASAPRPRAWSSRSVRVPARAGRTGP
jgi:mercuric ion transport protein